MQRATDTEKKMTQMASLRPVLLFLSLLSAAVLGTALVAQYAFGLPPCDLCIMQRYPYAAVIILGAGGFLFVRSSRVFVWLVLLSSLALATDAGIAWYHAGVEIGLFPGPEACSSTGDGALTLEEMRRQIMSAPLVPCNEAPMRWMGLSLAGWNGVIATALALFGFFRLFRWLRHERPR